MLSELVNLSNLVMLNLIDRNYYQNCKHLNYCYVFTVGNPNSDQQCTSLHFTFNHYSLRGSGLMFNVSTSL